MPRSDHYAGLTLPDALELLAKHHYQPDTRHISKGEYELLQAVPSPIQRSSSGTSTSDSVSTLFTGD